MPTESKKCAHLPCLCAAPPGEKYCSQFCKEAGPAESEIACDCGHPACEKRFLRRKTGGFSPRTSYSEIRQLLETLIPPSCVFSNLTAQFRRMEEINVDDSARVPDSLADRRPAHVAL